MEKWHMGMLVISCAGGNPRAKPVAPRVAFTFDIVAQCDKAIARAALSSYCELKEGRANDAR